MTKPAQVVDFVAVIDELRRHGFSERVIADHLRVPKASVHDWKQGSIPKYHTGERLLDLWAGVTGKPTSGAPRAAQLPTVSAARLW